MKLLIILSICSNALPSVLSLALGAPTAACNTLTPQHGANIPQSGTPPFTIQLSSLNVAPGGSISVLISSSTAFRGFLVQSRVASPGPTTSPGTFMTSSTSQSINCHAGISNSATHILNQERSSQTVVWSAPTNFRGQIRFHVSLVVNFATYWVNVQTPIVTVG